MSKFFTFTNINGKSKVAAGIYSDGAAGRIDFRFENISGSSVNIQLQDAALDGTGAANLGSAITLAPGAVNSISVCTVKRLINVTSASDNTGEAYVRLDAQYLGAPLRGTGLSPKEHSTLSGFTGSNIPR